MSVLLVSAAAIYRLITFDNKINRRVLMTVKLA